MTVFLSASTKPSGEPNRKKSDTSKSNFPREPPSKKVLLLDLREAASFRKTLECKLEWYHKAMPSLTNKINYVVDSKWNKDQSKAQKMFLSFHTPGQKGLVLFYRVYFIGGGVTSLAWQLSLGVVACAGSRDVYITATEVAAALQCWRWRSMPTVDDDARRQKILVLQGL